MSHITSILIVFLQVKRENIQYCLFVSNTFTFISTADSRRMQKTISLPTIQKSKNIAHQQVFEIRCDVIFTKNNILVHYIKLVLIENATIKTITFIII